MKKVIIGVVAIAIIALVVVGIVMISKNNENGGVSKNAKMQTVEEMQTTLNNIYTKLGE